MTALSFEVQDRIQKIRQINDEYDLLNNSYISFSGGKDSLVVSALINEAFPNNKIPRLFINTGIEYKEIVEFVKSQQKKDSRIEIINSGVNIKEMLQKNGFPFKSKEHAQKVSMFQRNGFTKTTLDYVGKGTKKNFTCPKNLLMQFESSYKFPISDKCCTILKKLPAKKWSEEHKKQIVITGIRKEEGGVRSSLGGCLSFDKNKKGVLRKFHAIYPISDSFISDFIKDRKLEVCKLYSPPYNFVRTGCKGCPFNIHLKEQLETMEKFLPQERKQCDLIFGEVYEEYRRLSYRL